MFKRSSGVTSCHYGNSPLLEILHISCSHTAEHYPWGRWVPALEIVSHYSSVTPVIVELAWNWNYPQKTWRWPKPGPLQHAVSAQPLSSGYLVQCWIPLSWCWRRRDLLCRLGRKLHKKKGRVKGWAFHDELSKTLLLSASVLLLCMVNRQHTDWQPKQQHGCLNHPCSGR